MMETDSGTEVECREFKPGETDVEGALRYERLCVKKVGVTGTSVYEGCRDVDRIVRYNLTERTELLFYEPSSLLNYTIFSDKPSHFVLFNSLTA
jgi:hypothetical protein